jgi:hypothetical protein
MNRFRLSLISLVILIGFMGCNNKSADNNENKQTDDMAKNMQAYQQEMLEKERIED